jgi:hypothetical protein
MMLVLNAPGNSSLNSVTPRSLMPGIAKPATTTTDRISTIQNSFLWFSSR